MWSRCVRLGMADIIGLAALTLPIVLLCLFKRIASVLSASQDPVCDVWNRRDGGDFENLRRI
jgi:hypothetical protein